MLLLTLSIKVANKSFVIAFEILGFVLVFRYSGPLSLTRQAMSARYPKSATQLSLGQITTTNKTYNRLQWLFETTN